MKVILVSPYTGITIALVIGLISAIQPDLPSQQQQKTFAELFTSETGTEIYDVTGANDNSIAIDDEHTDKESDQTTHSTFFQSLGIDVFENGTFTEKGIPVRTPDESYFTIEPEKLRSKRETPWQRTWRERYEQYSRRGQAVNSQAQRMAKAIDRPMRTTTTTTTTTTTPVALVRNKFARQFVSNDQDGPVQTDPDQDNNVVDSGNTDDATDAPTTTTTTEAPKTTRRHHRKTTTTEETTTAASDSDDSSDADSTADSTPDSAAIGSVVQGIVTDMTDKKEESRSGPLPPVITIPPLWMTVDNLDLDPRTSPKLQAMIAEKHNYLRSQVSPPAGNMLKMQWSDEAQAMAQKWANQCKFEHDEAEQRRIPLFKCGQNLARGWPKPLSWNLTMQLWFDERKDLPFGGPPRGMVGHYTQLVWAQSYIIGCAYKDCKTFHHYVCDYCPSGNLVSHEFSPYQKAENSCDGCPGHCDETGKLCTNSCPYVDKFSNCGDLNRDFQICTDASYGLQSACPATCNCQGKIH